MPRVSCYLTVPRVQFEIMGYQKFSEFITSYLNQKKEKDSKYSLRRLAAEIEINPGFLSSLVTGKRKLTRLMAEEILSKMNIERDQINYVLASIAEIDEPFNLTREQSDRCDLPVLTIERILSIRNIPIEIRELAHILNKSESEVRGWVQTLVDLDVASLDGEMVESKPHGYLVLHGSPEKRKAKTQQIVDLIQKDLQTADQLRERLPVHFLLASSDEHIQKNVKHYFNAVESITSALDAPAIADNVYLGFMYLLKVTNGKIGDDLS